MRAGVALAGIFKDKKPIILGWDLSGEVTKIGSAVHQFKEGDNVVYSSGKDMKVIADWLGKGIIKSYVSAVFPLNQMGAAHTSLESGSTVGKIVLTV